MKANELRIGNLVQSKDAICIADSTTINMAHNYEPILITEKWLFDFGFEQTIHSYYLDKECPFYICPFGNQLIIKSFGMDKLTSVKYVHQLQNLYFALTGEELMIKK